MITRRQLLGGLATWTVAAGAVHPGRARTGHIHEVTMIIQPVDYRPIPEFYFEPTGLYILPGDTVRWIALTPHHTVTAYHNQHGKIHRVPDGVPPFSSPVVPVEESWEYTFEVPGVYDYWCAPHEEYGMAGRLVVDFPAMKIDPITDFSPLGAYNVAGMVLNDPALEPLNIFFEGTIPWAKVDQGNKQLPDACPQES